MDDDLTFGTSVWGSADTTLPPPPKETASFTQATSAVTIHDGFDDFDDFGSSVQTSTDFGDFGDFGEFDEAQGGTTEDLHAEGFVHEGPQPGPSRTVRRPLKLDSMPSREELRKQVEDILGTIFGDVDISQVTTQERIREVEGIGQFLDTPGSRNLYKSLTAMPILKPPNWKQSRIRREHLIALGIPVNLDEVLPRANGKKLPPLHITTRPASTSSLPGNAQRQGQPSESSRAGSPRSGTPQDRHGTSLFGPKPQLDEQKISELLALDRETLSLLPLTTLEARLADIRVQTTQTSILLTHLLQTREALQQNSETYNNLIAELVGEAQKIKTGKGRPPGRR